MGKVFRMCGGNKHAYRIWVAEIEGTKYFGKYRCRCEENISKYFRELGQDYLDWIQMAQQCRSSNSYLQTLAVAKYIATGMEQCWDDTDRDTCSTG
jgi:hypothetical protein